MIGVQLHTIRTDIQRPKIQEGRGLCPSYTLTYIIFFVVVVVIKKKGGKRVQERYKKRKISEIV